MKKIVGLGLATLISMGALSGCSLFSEKTNGVVYYGSEQPVKTAISAVSGVREKDSYKMKLAIFNDKNVLIMEKKTANELVKKELWKKVGNGDETKVINKLPTITTEQGVLFAKEKLENVMIDGKKLKYEGNIIIGDLRSFVDMFAIVEDTEYASIIGEEKFVGILKLDRNPSKDKHITNEEKM
ncbi:lipoprotein BA_5634 family protein [Bacillus cereus]|uniref:lipoprotein BA_5634 family protein n=1 Tax=Bacillus cereus TaxID=1396 RepID=UPI000279D52F|nr:lipoprotein BA_5634 family protein [Bacillus cereus]EJR91143.1 hypothetical protein IKG_05780 [Bacillus cereus VD200]